ncbi:MAG: metallophosphoesterase [Chthoniobacterales bacterium]|nr:metallophosphoesterase [Chthoniobacterales bacterium]
MANAKKLRIAATADLHYGKHSQGKMQDLFAQVSREADVLLICGDLTDYGLPEEAELLAADLRLHLRIPVLAVLGNHDSESGQPEAVRKVMEDAGVTMLNGEATEVQGIGFAGVCGFGGGFGRRMLNAWGEPLIKAFVQEAIDQALRLEQALTQLQTEQRIVLMHYAPIRSTVEGEAPEIFPFLGSTRLEEPVNRFRVSAVFHGHAHNGTAEGASATQVPVFNVSAPLLQKHAPDKQPFRTFEL